jgi:putative ABC transport system permease protein
MLKNYFYSALRNLRKNKFYSLINVLGLAVGMAGFLLIAQYVFFEHSYDRFHAEADQIYRVQLDQYQNDEMILASAENYPGAGPALVAELPEVQSYTRLYNMGFKNNVVISYEEAPTGPVAFKLERFMYADSSFFSVFSFPLAQGDPAAVLAEPFTAVVSETYAKRFFGDADPVGKVLRLQDDDFNDERCRVTGVFRDVPQNSHLKFDVLFSYKTLYNRGDWARERYDLTWERKDFYTYVRVQEGTSPDALAAKFPAVVDKYSPGLAEQRRRDVLSLQPLGDIHLYSDLAEEAEANGSAQVVYFLLIIAGFILVIAWINYVNLSTARAMERGREVGVRKALGAFRYQLTKQFMIESLLINALAIAVAGVLVSLLLPVFNDLTGLRLSELAFWSQGWLWGLLAGLFVVGTLLSGLYPALMLASFRPARVLKGSLRTGKHGIRLRQALVVFQFAAAIVLVVGTAIVYQQMQYMLEADLGFNMKQTLVVNRPSIRPQDWEAQKSQYDQFKTELLRNPSVQQVSGASFIPGHARKFKFNFRRYGTPAEEALAIRVNGVDYDYFDMFEMNMLAGRGFQENHADEDTAVVITQSAAHALGYDDLESAVGAPLMISWGAEEGQLVVIGVVDDFHQASLKEAIEPMVLLLEGSHTEYYTMKVSADNLPQTVAHVEATWDEVFPGNPFSYFFLDDYFNRQYQTDQRFSQLIRVFAGLALFIGGLGLLGLSAFTAQQRTKEIGIRKVLGASVLNVTLLLSRDFTKLIVVAIALAVPLAYFMMDAWLSSYASRIEIGAGIFVLAGVFTLLVAWLTVSWQSVRAAVANPVDSLRSE